MQLRWKLAFLCASNVEVLTTFLVTILSKKGLRCLVFAALYNLEVSILVATILCHYSWTTEPARFPDTAMRELYFATSRLVNPNLMFVAATLLPPAGSHPSPFCLSSGMQAP
jgi:hypothetical protein